MFKHEDVTIKRMGVINITPNSFSDGGEFLDPELLSQKLQLFSTVESIDIGAESTAPKNDPIDSTEEWDRFQHWGLPFIKKLPPQVLVSIDTYHPETIFKISSILKDRPLMWNDISGQFDDSALQFLFSKANVSYVLSHNLAPERKLSGRHMDYVQETDDDSFFWDMVSFFSERLKMALAKNVEGRLVLDPCFGFSKTLEQNLYLMKNFAHLAREVKHPLWMIGISRKSFLQKKHQTHEQSILDQNHINDIHEILHGFPYERVWVRTHRPELLPASVRNY